MVNMDDLVEDEKDYRNSAAYKQGYKEEKEKLSKMSDEEADRYLDEKDEERELENQVRKLKEKQAKEAKIKSLKSEKYELENPIKSKIIKIVKSVPSKVGAGVGKVAVASYHAVEKAAKSAPQDKNSVRLGFNPNAMNDTFGSWGSPNIDQQSTQQKGYGFLQGSDPWGFNRPQAQVQQMSRKIIYKGKGKNKKKIVIMRPVPMQSAPAHNPFGGDYNIYKAAGKKQPENNPWRMI